MLKHDWMRNRERRTHRQGRDEESPDIAELAALTPDELARRLAELEAELQAAGWPRGYINRALADAERMANLDENKKVIALVAYLLRLGTDITKTLPEETAEEAAAAAD